MTARQIAIDGPAGAGKSTTAKAIAKKLGYLYIDTGAMYRAIALQAIRAGIAFDDEAALTQLARDTDIRLEQAGDTYSVFVNDEDVSRAIREPAVGNAASPVSAVGGVRQVLVEKQQAMAAALPVVMDGRDIGTVVLPHADLKVFLTANPQVRAERRTLELREKGIEADAAQVEAEIRQRDERDSSRANSPLRQAEDAVYIDSSEIDLNGVVEYILKLAEAR